MRMSNGARWAPAYDDRHRHCTPPEVLEPVRAAMGGVFGLDPASMEDNPTDALVWCYLPAVDGLSVRWTDHDAIWCNPPYGAAMRPFVTRAIEAGQAGRKVALLIPADTDTALSQAVLRGADAVLFINGRVRFAGLRKNGQYATAGHPSMLAAWGWDPAVLDLGVTLR